MRVLKKTKRYINGLYDEIKVIAPEYGVDPRICLVYAMACTGFAYDRLRQYSPRSRRLSLITFDRLFSNNIFFLRGTGTCSSVKVFNVRTGSFEIRPAFATRADAIRCFCAVIKRCFGGGLNDYTFTERLLAVWAAGYADDGVLFASVWVASNLLARVLDDDSFILTNSSRCGIIVKRLVGTSVRRRITLCRRYIADPPRGQAVLPCIDANYVHFIPCAISSVFKRLLCRGDS